MEHDPCPLCGRPMVPGRSVNKHHLLPKLKGGKGVTPCDVHAICHSKVHSVWSEAELARIYTDCDGEPERVWAVYLENEHIQKFVSWVSKKDPTFKDSNRRIKGHKRPRRK